MVYSLSLFRGNNTGSSFRRALTTILFLGWIVGSTSSGFGGGKYEFSEPHMGTLFRLVFYAQDQRTANRAANEAFARIAELERVFSTYDPKSEARRLCAGSAVDSWVTASSDLTRVLVIGQQISKSTDGAFDITIGPVTRIWRQARRSQRFPDRSKLDLAKKAVGYQLLQVDSDQSCIRLKHAGMRFDFGGIAKGDALDEVAKIFQKYQIDCFSIDGGGDILVGNVPPEEAGWPVSIPGLTIDGPPIKLRLTGGHAIATSGDIYQFLEYKGERYSHLIDPRTGWAVKGRRQVTLIAKKGVTADSWASAASVQPVPEALRVIGERRDLGLRILVERDGAIREYYAGGLQHLFCKDKK